MTEIKTTSIEVTLNGEKLIIQKLKAGKYYEAQRIYLGLLGNIQKSMKGNAEQIKKTTELAKKAIKDVKENKEDKKEITLDKESIDELSKEGLIDFDTLYSKFPQEIAGLVGFCIGVEKEKLLEDAYPEELADIAEKVINLNNFAENIKNSVAPLANLGAVQV
jgi:hypothetical protein